MRLPMPLTSFLQSLPCFAWPLPRLGLADSSHGYRGRDESNDGPGPEWVRTAGVLLVKRTIMLQMKFASWGCNLRDAKNYRLHVWACRPHSHACNCQCCRGRRQCGQHPLKRLSLFTKVSQLTVSFSEQLAPIVVRGLLKSARPFNGDRVQPCLTQLTASWKTHHAFKQTRSYLSASRP